MSNDSDPHFSPAFNPFAEAYLDDPYPQFGSLRASTPAFYAAEIDHWVVTRYRDIKQIFQSPRLFSAANALNPIKPFCPEAQRVLSGQGFAPVPSLPNNDPPSHTRIRRLANVAFTPRRVAQMETFVRDLVRRFLDSRFDSGHADFIRDLAWELPALVVFRVLGIPDDDVIRVKAGSESRLLMMWGRPSDEEQVRLARGMGDFWNYSAGLVQARSAEPRDDLTSDLLAARAGDEATLSHAEVTTVVYGLLLAGHETTTALLGNALR